MTLAVILLLLSDVRLASSRRTSLALLSDAASLSHCLLGVSAHILLKLMYILRAPLHNLLSLDKTGKRR